VHILVAFCELLLLFYGFFGTHKCTLKKKLHSIFFLKLSCGIFLHFLAFFCSFQKCCDLWTKRVFQICEIMLWKFLEDFERVHFGHIDDFNFGQRKLQNFVCNYPSSQYNTTHKKSAGLLGFGVTSILCTRVSFV